jgi:glycosyltransferase domain-containing protein
LIDGRLTLILPVYGRDDFTKRFVRYCQYNKCPFHIIIGNGKPNKKNINFFQNSKNFRGLSYEYHQFEDKNFYDFYSKMHKLATLVKTKYAMQVDNDDFVIFSGLSKMLDQLDKSSNLYISGKGLFGNFSLINNEAFGKLSYLEKNSTIQYSKKVNIKYEKDKVLFVIRNGIASYYNIIEKKYLVKILHEIKEMNFSDLFFHELYFSARLHMLGKELHNPNLLVYLRQTGSTLDSNKLNDGWGKIFLTRDFRGDFDKLCAKFKKEFNFELKIDLLNSFSFFLSNRINSVREFYINQNLFAGTFSLLIFLCFRLKKIYQIILSRFVFFIPARICNILNIIFFKYFFRKTQLKNSEILSILKALNDK